jgi:hypothetical protein
MPLLVLLFGEEIGTAAALMMLGYVILRSKSRR